MELLEVQRLLNAEILSQEGKLDTEAKFAFGCDLMSDVLAFVEEDTILLTGLTNIQTIRTAEMLDIKCIVFVRGKKPDESLICEANEKGIVVMCTKHMLFTACGILYSNGLKGAGTKND